MNTYLVNINREKKYLANGVKDGYKYEHWYKVDFQHLSIFDNYSRNRI